MVLRRSVLAWLGLAAALLLALLLYTLYAPPHPDSAGNQQVATPPSGPAVRLLRLGLNISADSALHDAAQRFASMIGERSAGRLKVEVYPDQQLGNDDQMLEMARAGSLDLLLIPTAKLSTAIPAMQYADLPFYFADKAELYAMLDGEPGRLLLGKLAAIDLVGLTFWENGFKQFTANVPIRTPADFAKLRVRTMKSRILADQFETLGAKAIPIDFHATWQALADGAVDAQENPLIAIVAMRFHEVQRHLTLSDHGYLAYAFTASRKTFEALPPEDRTLIEAVARELTAWERDETARREQKLLEIIRAAGVTIHTLDPEARAAFRAAMAPIADKFAFEIGHDLLAITEELRYHAALAALAPEAPRPLLIGLAADLSGGAAQAGGAILRGIQLAVTELNAQGGLLGRPLTIIARDHAGNAQLGRHQVIELASTPDMLAVFGGLHSAAVLEALPEIHRIGIPVLVPWAASQGLTNHDYRPNYVFRVSLSDQHVGPFLLQHALARGPRVRVLLERSSWGRSNESAMESLLAGRPAGEVGIEWLNIGDPALDAVADRLASDQVDAVVLVANPPEASRIVQALARQPHPPTVFAHWGLTGADFWRTNAATLDKVELLFVQSVIMDDTAHHPRLNAFKATYRARFGLDRDTPIPSPIGTAHAYDLTHLLALAVRQAGTSEHAAIRDALEQLPAFEGVMQTYAPAFSPENHEALDHSHLHLARFDDKGRIVAAD